MSETSPGSDDAHLARLDPSAIADALALRVGRTRGLRDQTAALNGTGTSDDGRVTVVVDSTGRLIDVAIHPVAEDAAAEPDTDLGALIVAASDEAVRDVEEQSEAINGVPPADLSLDSTQAILAELGTEFRTQADDDGGTDFDRLHKRLTGEV